MHIKLPSPQPSLKFDLDQSYLSRPGYYDRLSAPRLWLIERAETRASLSRALLQNLDIGLRLGGAFENMRGYAALFQRFAELYTQEAARRVAGDAGIEPVHQAADRRRVFVKQFRRDGEIVVVDDRVDPVPKRRELALHRLDDGAYFAVTAH